MAQRLAAKPRIRPNRPQGEVLRTFFEVDFMNPNGIAPMR
jgi:hypothetical protein